ncbi:acyltransferase family protein [Enterovirga aerilata]|uniref:Acyltransferase n=1 Tax=Enterovirga aerilata TaxID=2730920 RepID=A0A849HVZ4_9HYPH|nr:acyltransferase [Enterovirga sp. DB1703]NNM71272.1 acyltransferase [Enterovirga sp. DB1703]
MILSLQYLRGLAALAVVYFHIETQIVRIGGEIAPFGSLGRFGVDVFFVISGIVMWITTVRSQPTATEFLARRMARIAPLYWALTLAVVAVALLAPGAMRSTVVDGPHMIASLLFLPWPHPLGHGLSPVLIPGWTLLYELAFYLVFSQCLRTDEKRRPWTVLAILSAIAALGFAPDLPDAIRFYSDPIILEFGAGVVIGWLFTTAARPSRALSLLCLASGLMLAILFTVRPVPLHVLAIGGPVALIVAAFVLWEKSNGVPEIPSLNWLGGVSYSLYLTHILVLPVVRAIWSGFGISSGAVASAAFYVVSIVSSLVVAHLVWKFVEMPLTRLAQGLLSADRGRVGRSGGLAPERTAPAAQSQA